MKAIANLLGVLVFVVLVIGTSIAIFLGVARDSPEVGWPVFHTAVAIAAILSLFYLLCLRIQARQQIADHGNAEQETSKTP